MCSSLFFGENATLLVEFGLMLSRGAFLLVLLSEK